MKNRSCRACANYEAGTSECHADPPQMLGQVTQPRVIGGRAGWIFAAQWPRVNPEQWCGQFRPAITIMK